MLDGVHQLLRLLPRHLEIDVAALGPLLDSGRPFDSRKSWRPYAVIVHRSNKLSCFPRLFPCSWQQLRYDAANWMSAEVRAVFKS
jgi:hypothetical protein